MRSKGFLRLDVKIHTVTAHGDLAGDNIVATRIVCVMKPAVSVVIAVEGIPDGVTVLGLDIFPILETSVDLDTMHADHLGYGPDSLITPDILRHLHIIIVGISPFHRLDGPVEF